MRNYCPRQAISDAYGRDGEHYMGVHTEQPVHNDGTEQGISADVARGQVVLTWRSRLFSNLDSGCQPLFG
jgi:hypothetical protein